MAVPTQRARAALIEALWQARRDAGLTGAALAERIGAGWGQPKVSKIESGRQLPSKADIEAWAAATSVPVEQLLDVHGRAAHEYQTFRDAYGTEGGADAQQDGYGAAERASSVVIGFQPIIVHGLLQTPDYAQHLLRLPGGPADHGATSDEIDRMVAARMRRAAILYEPGREVTILIGEAALYNQVGGKEVMQSQRDHIARLATTAKHATVGIVPFNKFPVLIEHGWDLREKIVTLETTAGDLEIADPTEVAQYERWSQVLLAAAAVRAQAARLCQSATA